MDDSIKNLLTWVRTSPFEESALIDIKNPGDRKYFWNYWHTNKDFLKANGFRMSKESDGLFYIFHDIKDVEEEEKTRKEKDFTLSLSRASDFDIDIPVPTGLSYFGYQKAGIHFANQRKATLIGDEMGTGKTVMTAGVINSNSDIKSVLVICPASIRLNWKREFEKWLIKNYRVGIVNRSDYPEDSDIVIVNFDVVHKHHEVLTSKVWDLLVIDEVHFLKSKSSRRSKYIFGNKKDKISAIEANKKVFLSGTPMVNKPIELFPIIHALDPDTWDSQWKYAHRYCDPVHNGWGWDFNGASNLEELQDKLRSTIMIRRLKADVLSELPAKFRQIVELPADEKVFELIREEMTEWSNNENLIAALKTSVLMSRINEDKEGYKEAVNKLKDGLSASFGSMSKLRERVALAKLPYVLEHLQDIDGKVIVFAHHKSVIKKLKEKLGEQAVVIMGETSLVDRQSAVDSFQNDDNVKYFIGSIMAAGVGITLTASSHVVFAELDWVPGVINQCEDRSHRIGQKNSVLIQHLVLEGSLDAKMAKTLIEKQEVIDKALDIEYSLDDVVIPDEIIVPREEVIEQEANEISDEEKSELLSKIQFLASLDSDRASFSNNVGFNRFDSSIGHSLASQMFLTNRQAVIAKRLVNKYRKQVYESVT